MTILVENTMSEKDLMKACKILLHKDEWKYFRELLIRWRQEDMERAMNLEAPELYRAQGKVRMLTHILKRTDELKNNTIRL